MSGDREKTKSMVGSKSGKGTYTSHKCKWFAKFIVHTQAY